MTACPSRRPRGSPPDCPRGLAGFARAARAERAGRPRQTPCAQTLLKARQLFPPGTKLRLEAIGAGESAPATSAGSLRSPRRRRDSSPSAGPTADAAMRAPPRVRRATSTTVAATAAATTAVSRISIAVSSSRRLRRWPRFPLVERLARHRETWDCFGSGTPSGGVQNVILGAAPNLLSSSSLGAVLAVSWKLNRLPEVRKVPQRSIFGRFVSSRRPCRPLS